MQTTRQMAFKNKYIQSFPVEMFKQFCLVF